jgi:hypothetical protein
VRLANAAVKIEPEDQDFTPPTLKTFDPQKIPYQWEVLKTVRNWDYSKESLDILLSGTVGSAKSTLACHIGLTHCLLFPNAGLGIGRRALPDLKRTLFADLLEHIGTDLVDGKDFWYQESTATIQFRNGSEIIPLTWADRKYKKFGSVKLSAAIFEEITENDEQDAAAFHKIKTRVRRRPWVRENFTLSLCNPDEPDHWVAKYFDVDRGEE